MNRFYLPIFALLFVFWGVPAHAQNQQCRTAPVGTSTANCASEAFVTDSVGAAGNVKGPASSTTGHVATFADTTGKLIQDGGPSGGGTVTEQKNTASVGLITSGNCDNMSTNVGSPCNYALALNSATLQAAPSGFSVSTTSAMGGIGGTCKITPVYSGRLSVHITSVVNNAIAGQRVNIQAAFGTGTAPTVGQNPPVGTNIGVPESITSGTASGAGQAVSGAIVTGLTPGTAYWFDLVASTTSSSGGVGSIGCSLSEF